MWMKSVYGWMAYSLVRNWHSCCQWQIELYCATKSAFPKHGRIRAWGTFCLAVNEALECIRYEKECPPSVRRQRCYDVMWCIRISVADIRNLVFILSIARRQSRTKKNDNEMQKWQVHPAAAANSNGPPLQYDILCKRQRCLRDIHTHTLSSEIVPMPNKIDWAALLSAFFFSNWVQKVSALTIFINVCQQVAGRVWFVCPKYNPTFFLLLCVGCRCPLSLSFFLFFFFFAVVHSDRQWVPAIPVTHCKLPMANERNHQHSRIHCFFSCSVSTWHSLYCHHFLGLDEVLVVGEVFSASLYFFFFIHSLFCLRIYTH